MPFRGTRRALLYKRPAAAAAGGWSDPLDASTPAIWWIDANNSGSLTIGGGSTVTQWNDLGTGGNNLTTGVAPVYTTGVLNGLPGVDFNGGGTLLTGVFSVAQPLMVVIVWKQSASAPSASGFILDGDRVSSAANRLIIINNFTGGNYNTYANTLVDQGVAIATNTAYHSRAVFNGASSSSKLNASVLTGTNPGIGTIANGICLNPNSAQSNAIICEAYIVENPTAGDLTNSDAYVLAKWGV